MQPKILLACPTYDGKKYCQDKWLNHIENLTYDDIDFLVVENSITPDNYKYLQKNYQWLNVLRCIHKKNESPQKRVLRSLEMIYHFFKMDNYTHLFMLESDQFPPVNCVEYLLDMDTYICQLPYFHQEGDKTMLMACDYVNTDTIDFMPPFKSFMWATGIKDALQTGIGCTLLHREVVQGVPPRLDKKFPKQYPDVFFHIDWACAGYKVKISFMADYSVHENTKFGWK